MRRALAAAGGLGLIASLVMWELRPDPSLTSQARPVTLPLAATATVAPGVAASPAPSSGLVHDRAPDTGALREAPTRQALYDAEAKPGEFVTPPNVSIEH